MSEITLKDLLQDAVKFLGKPDISVAEKLNIIESERNILELPDWVKNRIYCRVGKEWYTRRNKDAALIDEMKADAAHATAILAPDNIFVSAAYQTLSELLKEM